MSEYVLKDGSTVEVHPEIADIIERNKERLSRLEQENARLIVDIVGLRAIIRQIEEKAGTALR